MMLATDKQTCSRRFPDAMSYMVGAALRWEAYGLACELLQPGLLLPGRVVWMRARLAELAQCPACREPWFAEQLRREYEYELLALDAEEVTP